MRMITEADHEELLAAREERDRLVAFLSNGAASEIALQASADALVQACDRAGYVLTVEQWSVPPLAMGHYTSIATVRKARGA